MSLANLSILNTFYDWLTRTNQIIVIANELTDGNLTTFGTITFDGPGTTVNVVNNAVIGGDLSFVGVGEKINVQTGTANFHGGVGITGDVYSVNLNAASRLIVGTAAYGSANLTPYPPVLIANGNVYVARALVITGANSALLDYWAGDSMQVSGNATFSGRYNTITGTMDVYGDYQQHSSNVKIGNANPETFWNANFPGATHGLEFLAVNGHVYHAGNTYLEGSTFFNSDLSIKGNVYFGNSLLQFTTSNYHDANGYIFANGTYLTGVPRVIDSIYSQSTVNAASANAVNTLANLAVVIFNQANAAYTKANSGGNSPNVEYQLIDSGTIAWDVSANGPAANITLGGNRLLANATNQQPGHTYILRIINPSNYQLTFQKGYIFVNNVAPTSIPNTTLLTAYSDGSLMYVSALSGFRR